jgi:Cu(I)/Ag(I) efflux system membrane fusion protein
MSDAHLNPSGNNETRSPNTTARGREKTWLAAGLLIGAALAAFVFWGSQYMTSRQQPSAAVSANSTDVSISQESPTADAALSVQLSDQEQKAIGIETLEVQRRSIGKEISAPGKVVEPESGIGSISARIGGRIDKLLLSITGETVNRGQAVAQLYSPEVFTAGEEYRLALENRQRLSASKEPRALSDADELVSASRRRLELWGLTSEQIEEIASSAEKAPQTTVYSPLSGVVTKRNVTEGQYVKEGDVLFEVTDLSTVWIQAGVFEADIPLIHTGQKVKISAPTLAGGSVTGTVNFLQPSVDAQSRTMIARIQVPNPQMRLRPGMFVQVSLQTQIGNDVVAVPRTAVLDTGKEKVVYVAKENGVFEKRPIEAITSGDDFYAVTRGVNVGERVVTNGNFLIDSQTRLTGSITGMFGGSKAYGDASASQPNPATYTITLLVEPAAPKGGSESAFHVKVTDPAGKPISDAHVRLTLLMPAMPAMGMSEMRSVVDLNWNGSEYLGKGTVPMAGTWNVTVEAQRGGQLLGVYRSRLDAK